MKPLPPRLLSALAAVRSGLEVAARVALVVLAVCFVWLVLTTAGLFGVLAFLGVVAAAAVLATAPFGKGDVSVGSALLVGFVLAFALVAVAVAS